MAVIFEVMGLNEIIAIVIDPSLLAAGELLITFHLTK
jgi:hypothetical protein